MRGAGKSTVGAALAARVGARFVELDREIETTAGLPLAQLFELHGETYYRRVQREVLVRLLATGEALDPSAPPAGAASRSGSRALVLATGGSIVQDAASYALLRARCTTVWLRARAEDHWSRVVAQGDLRPMAGSPHAFEELRALLAAREALYARADHVVETSGVSARKVIATLATTLAAPA